MGTPLMWAAWGGAVPMWVTVLLSAALVVLVVFVALARRGQPSARAAGRESRSGSEARAETAGHSDMSRYGHD